MLNDCLVIGRNTGGTKEQLDNGLKMSGHEIGLRFLDNRELSERINSVKYMSLDEYKTLVSSAKKTVMDLYSVDKNVNQTYNFIMEIMNIKNETDSVQN